MLIWQKLLIAGEYSIEWWSVKKASFGGLVFTRDSML